MAKAAKPQIGPPPQVVTVSAQTVGDLAKSALVPIRCETLVAVNTERAGNTKMLCAQELSCWKTFQKHQIKKHGGKRRTATGGNIYVCRLNKCSAVNHSSSNAFKAHVELSHMKSVSLPCPFANCKPKIPAFGRPTQYNMFLKEKDLVAHLESHHADLIGCQLDLRDPRLLPSWEPLPPLYQVPPPDLPSGLIPTATFRLEELPPRIIHSHAWFYRLEAEAESQSSELASQSFSSSLAPPSTPVPLSHTPTTPAGRRRLLLRSPTRLPAPPPPASSQPEVEYDFDDLPKVEYDSDTDPPEVADTPIFSVQRASTGAERCELVRAFAMGNVPLPERPPPPTSIFHEALRQQVYAQYALGESAATDSLSIDGGAALSGSNTPAPP